MINRRSLLLLIAGFFLFFAATGIVRAQCVNTSVPTCGVYTTCFAKLCNCASSPYEYFNSYGKKYCATFLELNSLTAEGKKWRDSTLKCLQETIVPILPADGKQDTCACKAMQLRAFDQHVACYTKTTNSICDLPASDWVQSDCRRRRQELG
jgi:hypothetical protein